MTVYGFDEQREVGEQGAGFLDDYFMRYYKGRLSIYRTNSHDDRSGIDRIFRDHRTNELFGVEYKTDRKSSITRKVFIETVSVDHPRKDGWAHTAQASELVYFLPIQKRIFATTLDAVRQHLKAWEQEYGVRPSWNNGYRTWGIPVPIDVFACICHELPYNV